MSESTLEAEIIKYMEAVSKAEAEKRKLLSSHQMTLQKIINSCRKYKNKPKYDDWYDGCCSRI